MTLAFLTSAIMSILLRWPRAISTDKVSPELRSLRRELVSMNPVQQSAQQTIGSLLFIVVDLEVRAGFLTESGP
ncbi:hypothetical protein [Desulfovibrio gilichinskyi]|uniref:Uncharacterized protein n=1 Tax=Desulfovibrio gilichinskyi TaxID=1519643 RepID=A0A1X7CQS6_9BACT|nr:hypothetical protein [Desulfovibrio gilichinskyi]SMF01250.1 hypothetical protein SAMN06295933_1110 [Desulfovibrio gilichinskyi]